MIILYIQTLLLVLTLSNFQLFKNFKFCYSPVSIMSSHTISSPFCSQPHSVGGELRLPQSMFQSVQEDNVLGPAAQNCELLPNAGILDPILDTFNFDDWIKLPDGISHFQLLLMVGSSTGSHSLAKAACTVCLGHHTHNIWHCNVRELWNRQKAYVFQNRSGQLINPDRKELCTNWQKPWGCTVLSHNHKHECSGYGKKDHTAQKCNFAQSI